MRLNLPRFSGRKSPATSRTTSSRTQSSATYTTFGSDTYNTGKANDEVEDSAVEDGSYGVGNPDITGENALLHFLNALVSGHRSARGVIAHGMRGMLQEIAATLAVLLPQIKVSRAAALRAIDAHTSAQKQNLVLREEHRASGVLLPKRRGWLHIFGFVLLFSGDWTLITTSFQLFGLSDHPWIPGLGFTDDLHIAAISAVAMLVIIAELLGGRIRALLHDLRQRGERGSTPWIVTAVLTVALLVFGVVALIGLAEMRSEYLIQNGIDANSWPFIVLQLGIFIAAIGLGYVGAPDPEAVEWRRKLERSVGEVNTTGDAQHHALSTYSAEVGRYNAGVHQLNTVTAQAGHHVLTDRHSVGVQGPMYLRRYLLSQSADQIADKAVPTSGYEDVPSYTEASLLAALTGVKPLPKFSLLSTAALEQHLADARAEVEQLRWRIDQKGIDALELPEYEKSERERLAGDDVADNGDRDPDEVVDDELDEEPIDLEDRADEVGDPWKFPVGNADDTSAEIIDLPVDGDDEDEDGDESAAKP